MHKLTLACTVAFAAVVAACLPQKASSSMEKKRPEPKPKAAKNAAAPAKAAPKPTAPPPAAKKVAPAAGVAEMLPAKPRGFGQPIADRAAWKRLAKDESWQALVKRAAGLLKEPIAEQPDDLFLDFSRTGNRSRWQSVAFRNRSRITTLTLAECIENKGRFLPALEAIIAAVCAERTWVMPAHDRRLDSFHGRMIDIDLAASHLGANLASVHWLLGDKLSPKTRTLIRDELRRRIFDPFHAKLAGKHKGMWWLKGTNNWNTVCLANVVGAALAMIDSRDERTTFVDAGVTYSAYFLKGIPSDGYCTEGVGYWNYGYGHYVLLAEAIVQATDGGVDLFARKDAYAPAIYGRRIQIVNGVCPAFADCGVTARPADKIMQFVGRRYGLGADPAGDDVFLRPGGNLFDTLMYAFPNSATKAPQAKAEAEGPGLRDWFDVAGVLIARPTPGSPCRVGVALKGGHNAEHHNHNDVGSYVFVVGDQPVVLDPGGEAYTARTFSGQRYVSNVLNSFGHPVPRVAGKLQSKGRRAAAKVLRTEFTDAQDTLALDLKAAYAVKELKKLHRTFVYSRTGQGSLAVTDEVEFATPQAFETVLVTLGRWKQKGKTLTLYDFGEAARVTLAASADVEVTSEEIKEDVHTHSLPARIAIRFKQPVTQATVTAKIVPMELPAAKDGSLLRNGDFALEDWCWFIPRDGFGAISSEQAASGKHSLKITDAQKDRGSNIVSARIPVDGGGNFVLRGKVFGVSGDGVGLYVRTLDKGRRMLNPVDARGNMPSIGTVGGSSKKWEAFAFPFTAPKATAFLQVWIHSYNAALVEAYLDDLAIVKK